MKNFFYNRNNLAKILLLALLYVIISLPSITYAQAPKEYTLLEPLPCIPSEGVTCAGGDLAPQTKIDLNTYIIYAFNLLIALAAVAAVFMIVWGGFLYMTSDSIPHKQDGLKKVWNAVIGLVMVLITFLIMRTVNPKLVEVPPDLVPAIVGIKYDSAKTFFDELQHEADRYNVKQQDLVKTTLEVKNKLDSLQKQKTEKMGELNRAYYEYIDGEPVIEKLKADLADIDNQINDVTAVVTVKAASLALNDTLRKAATDLQKTNSNNLSKSVIDDFFDKKIKEVNTLRDSANSGLTKLNQPQQIYLPGGINDQANGAEIALDLMKIDTITSNTIFYSTKLGLKEATAYSMEQGKSLPVGDVKNEISTILATIPSKIKSNVKDPIIAKELSDKYESSKKLLDQIFANRK